MFIDTAGSWSLNMYQYKNNPQKDIGTAEQLKAYRGSPTVIHLFPQSTCAQEFMHLLHIVCCTHERLHVHDFRANNIGPVVPCGYWI